MIYAKITLLPLVYIKISVFYIIFTISGISYQNIKSTNQSNKQI